MEDKEEDEKAPLRSSESENDSGIAMKVEKAPTPPTIVVSEPIVTAEKPKKKRLPRTVISPLQ